MTGIRLCFTDVKSDGIVGSKRTDAAAATNSVITDCRALRLAAQ